MEEEGREENDRLEDEYGEKMKACEGQRTLEEGRRGEGKESVWKGQV